MKTLKLIASIVALFALTSCMPNYSNGSRVGVVNKLSHKGIAFKSWEGEMNLGGFRNKTDAEGRTSVVANVFRFSVTDSAIAKQIEEQMISGETVELVYRQWLLSPITQDSDYTIVAVKAAK